MTFGFTNSKVRAVDEIRMAPPGTPAKGRAARMGADSAALRLGLCARAVSRRAAAQDCIGHAPGRCTAQERVSSAGGPWAARRLLECLCSRSRRTRRRVLVADWPQPSAVGAAAVANESRGGRAPDFSRTGPGQRRLRSAGDPSLHEKARPRDLLRQEADDRPRRQGPVRKAPHFGSALVPLGHRRGHRVHDRRARGPHRLRANREPASAR